MVDNTEIKYPNKSYALLPTWRIKNNNKVHGSEVSNFLKSTKTNSPTPDSGAMSLSPLGNAFMHIETSSNNNGENVFVSFERTDIIQTSNKTFYYNRFSSTDSNVRAICRFRIQLLLEDNTTQYTIAKNSQYSDISTDWTLLNLNVFVENYGIRLIYDEIDSAHADMCFSIITITHSVY